MLRAVSEHAASFLDRQQRVVLTEVAGDRYDSRRTSALEEVRDGGYGVGSAAIIDDGAIPLGHPVKAWEDTKTFVTPDHPTYGHADPHLWFTDADAAQKAGFRGVD